MLLFDFQWHKFHSQWLDVDLCYKELLLIIFYLRCGSMKINAWQCVSPYRSMLMTACDISAITKPWPVQKRVKHPLYLSICVVWTAILGLLRSNVSFLFPYFWLLWSVSVGHMTPCFSPSSEAIQWYSSLHIIENKNICVMRDYLAVFRPVCLACGSPLWYRQSLDT